MLKPWPRLIKRIEGPRLWVRVDLSRTPAIVIESVIAEHYKADIDYLVRLSGLMAVTDSRYEAPLLDQVADAMVDLAFLNRHGSKDEGFSDPSHWR